MKSLYTSDRTPQEMARLKTQILGELQEEYRVLRNGPWNGFAGYDRWFGQEINNATLASVGIYTELVPAFEALLARNGGDLPLFYGEVKRLAALPKDDRQARLARVLAAVTQSAEFRAR